MNTQIRLQKLPFLGVWELNKSVMLLLGSVIVTGATLVSSLAFMQAFSIGWEPADLNMLYGFAALMSAGLLWASACRVDFIQNFSSRPSARLLAGFLSAVLVLTGAFELLAVFGADTTGFYSAVRYSGFMLVAAAAFIWAAVNRSKPVPEIRNAVSCVIFGILFYASARFLETLALISLQYSLFCRITAVHFQTMGAVLAFTGIVLYERFVYSLYQYKLSRRYAASADASTDTLQWLMESIGTPPRKARPAEAPEETGVSLTNR